MNSPGKRPLVWRSDVVAAFTGIRRQTAMNRQSGAPRENTLRATRTLHPGLTFDAEICGDMSLANVCAIALASAALREMGASRWRGLGRVRCHLVETGDTARPPHDWTAAALAVLSPKSFELPLLPTEAQHGEVIEEERPAADSEVLRFELRLQDAAVFPSLRTDPNTVTSLEYIPGSSIHGFFARRLLTPQGPNQEFRDCFTSGGVRFSNAYPAREHTRLVPIPNSLRQSKEDHERYIDLSRVDAQPGFRRARSWIDPGQLIARGGLRTGEVKTVLHYHHARADHPMVQRAAGRTEAQQLHLNALDTGNFFQFEALGPDQTFLGHIQGPPESLKRLRNLVPSGTKLDLGRSRSAQYGARAKLTWLEVLAPVTPSQRNAVIASFTVLLVSPVLSCNDVGHPVPCFPTSELTAALGPEVELKLEPKHFARTEWHGGYLSHQRLPRQQMPALAAGGVLIFHVVKGRVTAEALDKAGERSYGLRREHGFGEIRIVARAGITTAIHAAEWEDAADPALAPAVGSPEAKLAARLFHEQLIRRARHRARDLAQFQTRNYPTKHLLHRLRAMLAAQSQNEFQESLRKLRSRAKSSLESARVHYRARMTMLEFLQIGWVEIHNDLSKQLLAERWQDILPTQQRVTFEPEIARLFLAEYLAAAAKSADRTQVPSQGGIPR
jgi:CRISPR-associated protein Csx10